MPTLPPRLAALQSQAGKNRKGRKLLVFGDSKTGKSFFAASAPGPLAALACTEPGIVPYLDPKRGDIGLEIYTKDDYYHAMDFLLTQQDSYRTIIVDNGDLLFSQIMQDIEDELDHEIKSNDWRKVKGPWNAMLFKVAQSKQNFVMTTGRRDINYTTEESGIAGVSGRFAILPQDVPHVEKNVPRFVDMIFKTDVLKNKLNQPTNMHTVTFVGGRRPRLVSPSELYTGRAWKFDSKAVPPPNVWDAVVAPLDAKWDEEAVEHLGIDVSEARMAANEMHQAFLDQEVGRLIGIIARPYKSLKEFADTFAKEIQADLNALDEGRKAQVVAAKEQRKGELK